MSETKYTPGPWRPGIAGNLRVYGPDGQGEHSGLIAEVFKGRGNVNLITAAPELLEALERLMARLDGYFGSDTLYDWQEQANARVVIAKARGEA